MIAFGPIHSRRLGSSLGINNIPTKHCSYACVYCQAGPTPLTETLRRAFYDPAEIFEAVRERVEACRRQGQPIDYLSFVPDGEPTLDVNLDLAIARVATLGIPVAVITNGSLLWLSEVRRAIAGADLVSIEIDTTSKTAWRAIDRPSPTLSLATVLSGIEQFSREYRGTLMTQTMLVGGINDSPEEVVRTADFVRRLQPSRAFLSIPTRPPADPRMRPPDPETIGFAYALMSARIPTLELMTATDQGAIGSSGNTIGDLLGTLTVHPMRLPDVHRYLTEGGVDTARLDELIVAGELEQVDYRGETFVIRSVARGTLTGR